MSTPSPASGFILAGGQSLRLGRDKALLNWHGKSLLDHMTSLLESVCHPVMIVGRGDVPDVVPGLGPIGGILTALNCSSTSLNLIVAVDLPLLTSRFLNDFIQWCDSSPRDLIACKIASGYPLCLGMRQGLKRTVENYVRSGERSLHGLLEGVHCEVIDAPRLHQAGHEDTLFLNINTESDYQAALNVG